VEIQLSPRQQNTVAVAVTILSVAVIVCAVAGLLWLLAIFLQTFSRVFLPLAVAGVIALVLNPYFEWLRGRARLPTGLAVAVVFLSILLPIVGFFWFFGWVVMEQISDLLQRLPDWWAGVRAWFERSWPQVVTFFDEHPLGERIREAATGQAGAVAEGLQVVGLRTLHLGAWLLGTAGTLLAWVVLPIYLIFFLVIDSRKVGPIEGYLTFLKPETRRDVGYLAREFVRIVVTFFRGQLLIAFLQGVLFAIGFSAVGLRYGLVLGLVLGFLNIIPYLGSILGLGVTLPLAFFQEGGGWWLLWSVLAIFTVVQLIESYLLTPRIMGERTGLHPMAVIVAIFFWGTALQGILGMILAIPLTAFLVVLWRLAEEKYVREVV
jgi:predicted PurR-regulated permease PerM